MLFDVRFVFVVVRCVVFLFVVIRSTFVVCCWLIIGGCLMFVDIF